MFTKRLEFFTGMAAEPRSSRRVWHAALSATIDSSSTAAAIPAATSTQSLAEKPAEGVQGLQLARQEIAEAAAVPATAQQRALSGPQENRPRGAKRANASRSRGLRDGDEAQQHVQPADRGGYRAAFRHQVDRLLE